MIRQRPEPRELNPMSVGIPSVQNRRLIWKAFQIRNGKSISGSEIEGTIFESHTGEHFVTEMETQSGSKVEKHFRLTNGKALPGQRMGKAFPGQQNWEGTFGTNTNSFRDNWGKQFGIVEAPPRFGASGP